MEGVILERRQMTFYHEVHLYRPQGEEQSNASPNYKNSQYTAHHTTRAPTNSRHRKNSIERPVQGTRTGSRIP